MELEETDTLFQEELSDLSEVAPEAVTSLDEVSLTGVTQNGLILSGAPNLSCNDKSSQVELFSRNQIISQSNFYRVK